MGHRGNNLAARIGGTSRKRKQAKSNVHFAHTLYFKRLKSFVYPSSPSSGPRKSALYRVETWRSYREDSFNCRQRRSSRRVEGQFTRFGGAEPP
jgi:hypothetical protein